jgi:hypothetical protein
MAARPHQRPPLAWRGAFYADGSLTRWSLRSFVANLPRKYLVQVIREEYTHDQPSGAGDQLRRPGRAARIIQDALGIEGDDVVNYCFPQTWPTDRERRARVIGEWLKTEAPGLVTEPRRFPPPWSAEETDACFIEKPPRFGASNGRME